MESFYGLLCSVNYSDFCIWSEPHSITGTLRPENQKHNAPFGIVRDPATIPTSAVYWPQRKCDDPFVVECRASDKKTVLEDYERSWKFMCATDEHERALWIASIDKAKELANTNVCVLNVSVCLLVHANAIVCTVYCMSFCLCATCVFRP